MPNKRRAPAFIVPGHALVPLKNSSHATCSCGHFNVNLSSHTQRKWWHYRHKKEMSPELWDQWRRLDYDFRVKQIQEERPDDPNPRPLYGFFPYTVDWI